MSLSVYKTIMDDSQCSLKSFVELVNIHVAFIEGTFDGWRLNVCTFTHPHNDP